MIGNSEPSEHHDDWRGEAKAVAPLAASGVAVEFVHGDGRRSRSRLRVGAWSALTYACASLAVVSNERRWRHDDAPAVTCSSRTLRM